MSGQPSIRSFSSVHEGPVARRRGRCEGSRAAGSTHPACKRRSIPPIHSRHRPLVPSKAWLRGATGRNTISLFPFVSRLRAGPQCFDAADAGSARSSRAMARCPIGRASTATESATLNGKRYQPADRQAKPNTAHPTKKRRPEGRQGVLKRGGCRAAASSSQSRRPDIRPIT